MTQEKGHTPKPTPPKKSKWISRLMWGGLLLVATYFLLLIPEADPPTPVPAGKSPFIWNQDALWDSYEKQFQAAKAAGCETFSEDIDLSIAQIRGMIRTLDSSRYQPGHQIYKNLETQFFNMAPLIGVCENRLTEYSNLFGEIRTAVKFQSRRWDMNKPEARQTLYRLFYGGRAAVEELMLQVGPENLEALTPGADEASVTPVTDILGVKIRSGDILLSRGGAAASALIARGNDFPGNFSHVALVHVDEKTNKPSIVEAHIEKGVAIADLQGYLADKKLRVLALRPRRDLLAMTTDPMTPHKAAQFAVDDANNRHIPYDFKMNFHNPDALFCSEVAFNAYRVQQLNLWMGISTISSSGLVRWLSQIGVRHFETHEPSDLEYDPQLVVVAEWRNLETLYQDHLDNAVIDVMLEGAEQGAELTYNTFTLPIARTMKGYSWILNQFGGVGPVPEGMSASTALRIQDFADRHESMRIQLTALADTFQKENGYRPPYWTLITLAKQVAGQEQ